jgi:hypothetical protein
MLTKIIETGMVSILSDGQIQVREDTVVDEDGVEISRTYHRTVLEPSISTEAITNPRVKAIAQAVWTPAVIAAFADARARATSPPPGLPPPADG